MHFPFSLSRHLSQQPKPTSQEKNIHSQPYLLYPNKHFQSNNGSSSSSILHFRFMPLVSLLLLLLNITNDQPHLSRFFPFCLVALSQSEYYALARSTTFTTTTITTTTTVAFRVVCVVFLVLLILIIIALHCSIFFLSTSKHHTRCFSHKK